MTVARLVKCFFQIKRPKLNPVVSERTLHEELEKLRESTERLKKALELFLEKRDVAL